MKNKKNIIFYLIISAFLSSCGNDGKVVENNKETQIKKQETQTSKNLNISILIDLSDRISPTINPNPSMQYFQRDLGYIETISKTFETELSKRPIRQINDEIQVYFEPAPQNPQINSLAENLKLSFDKNNTTKTKLQSINPIFKNNTAKIYNLAIQNKQFDGSDIYSFFKNNVKDYCIKDKHRNILVILTDGYMYYKNSKFMQGNKSSYLTTQLIKSFKLNNDFKNTFETKKLGFIPATNNLENLEILVLGINPSKNNPFEGDIMKYYWQDWFKKMGVKKFEIKQADLPSNLEPVIQRFISGK